MLLDDWRRKQRKAAQRRNLLENRLQASKAKLSSMQRSENRLTYSWLDLAVPTDDPRRAHGFANWEWAWE